MTDQADADSGEKYAITSEQDIRSLLKRLMDQRSLFTAHFGEGRLFLLTALLGFAEDGGLYVDVSAEDEINARVRAAASLLFRSQLDHVEVRFRCGPAVPTEYEGMPAFHVPLPTQVRYLQRREFFRLPIPVSQPVHCEVPVAPAADGRPRAPMKLRVLDIGAGGLALWLPPGQETALEAGMRLEGCRLGLPEAGAIQLALQVRHVYEHTDARGQPRTQAGCAFLTPSPALQAMVQRYVMRVERERIARERGLG